MQGKGRHGQITRLPFTLPCQGLLASALQVLCKWFTLTTKDKDDYQNVICSVIVIGEVMEVLCHVTNGDFCFFNAR